MKVIHLGDGLTVVNIEPGEPLEDGTCRPRLVLRHVGDLGMKIGQTVDLPPEQVDELTDHDKSVAIEFANVGSAAVVWGALEALLHSAVNSPIHH